MFRSVGSILFGIAADRYGRKWPFIVNNVLFIVLELVSISFLFVADDVFVQLLVPGSAKALIHPFNGHAGRHAPQPLRRLSFPGHNISF